MKWSCDRAITLRVAVSVIGDAAGGGGVELTVAIAEHTLNKKSI